MFSPSRNLDVGKFSPEESPILRGLYPKDGLPEVSTGPFRTKDEKFRGYYVLIQTLEKDAQVYPFPVGDMAHLPEYTEVFWVRGPEELILVQAPDFLERISVPEAISV